MPKKTRTRAARSTSKATRTRGAAKVTRKATNASPMDSIVAYLKARPKAAYADVRAAADKAGHTIYPIMFGRAKAMLGLVPTKRRRKAAAAITTRTPRTRTRRGRRVAAASFNGSLDRIRSMLHDYEAVKRERDALREALEGVRRAVNHAGR